MTFKDFVEVLLLLATILGTLGVAVALTVTAFIFFRSRQDISEIKEMHASLAKLRLKVEEADYISDEIASVMYDLFEMIGQLRAYIELSDVGIKADKALFDDMNVRVTLAEKHFLELGLFSQDEERRKSVQLALVSRYGDFGTINIMRKITDGKIGIRDVGIVNSLKQLERRLNDSRIVVDSSSWTGRRSWPGRPSGGSF